ncbi:MAG: 50S ribosomal protein L25 [Parachlamydiales bacterium]|nr:50S ribosomal protein L25 [Parachlamydiales bacterium]
MKLAVFKREGRKDNYKIRVEGNIPAILYGPKYKNETIYILGEEFQNFLRLSEKGLLSTTVFTLQYGDKKLQAIVKDIHYHPTTYSIIHIDFAVLSDDVPVTVHVPIQCTGVEECVGVKLGGTLRQMVRALKVRCLPKYIPRSFVVDVRSMDVMHVKRLAEITIPKHVTPMANLSEIAVVVAKR